MITKTTMPAWMGASPDLLMDVPPPEAWRAWRMARTGLGKPAPAGIAQSLEYSSHLKKRKLSAGLTRDGVADILSSDRCGLKDRTVTDRDVRRYIKSCWNYCARTRQDGGTGEVFIALLLCRDDDELADLQIKLTKKTGG